MDMDMKLKIEKEDNKIEEVSFDDFYSELECQIENSEEVSVMPPESRLKAREWLYAVIKLEDEISFLKDEYIKYLTEKHILPVKEKIKKYDKSIEILRLGLRKFLENAEEQKVNFPDLATVSKFNPQNQIIYPDDERELAERLHKEESEYINLNPKLDKKKIRDFFKKNKNLPISDLSIVDSIPTVKITREKKK